MGIRALSDRKSLRDIVRAVSTAKGGGFQIFLEFSAFVMVQRTLPEWFR